jgi:hypothetical protein
MALVDKQLQKWNKLRLKHQEEEDAMTTKGPNTQPAQPTPRQQYYEWIDALNESSSMHLTGYGKEIIVSAIEKFAAQAVGRAQATPPSPAVPAELGEAIPVSELIERLEQRGVELNAEHTTANGQLMLKAAHYLRNPSLPSEPLREALERTEQVYRAVLKAMDLLTEDETDEARAVLERVLGQACPVGMRQLLSAPMPTPVNTAMPAGSEVREFRNKFAATLLTLRYIAKTCAENPKKSDAKYIMERIEEQILALPGDTAAALTQPVPAEKVENDWQPISELPEHGVFEFKDRFGRVFEAMKERTDIRHVYGTFLSHKNLVAFRPLESSATTGGAK